MAVNSISGVRLDHLDIAAFIMLRRPDLGKGAGLMRQGLSELQSLQVRRLQRAHHAPCCFET